MNQKDIFIVIIKIFKVSMKMILKINVREYYKNLQKNNYKIKTYYLDQKKY